jgi:hypothetical protein
MAAPTLQSANLVWQKVQNFLSADQAAASAQGSAPAAQGAFKDLKAYLAQQKRNPQLGFIEFTAEQLIAVDGLLLGDTSTYHIYGIYARTRSTQTGTVGYVGVFQGADTDSTTTQLVSFRVFDVQQGFCYINGPGLLVSTAGALIAQTTAVGGPNESAVADAPDGFVIVG